MKKFRLLYFIFFFLLHHGLNAQLINHYWSQSYNSISSLLSGAVVAGGAGQASIYYNPANINEFAHGTNISLAASFMTLNHYSFYNALGSGNHLSTTNFYVQPQFFAITINPPIKKMSIEIATFTRIKERLNMGYGNSEYEDFITDTPILERYSTSYSHQNDYTDTWFGIGAAYEFNKELSVGMSLLFSSSTVDYFFDLNALVNPFVDSITEIPSESQYVFAENSYLERIKFTNVRMVTKLGISYKPKKWSFGLNLTLPPLNIFSTGKVVERSQKELYNAELEDGYFSYFIYDVQEEKEVKTNFKLPFSVALGIIYNRSQKNQKFFATIEYFAGIKAYKMVEASTNELITSKPVYDLLDNKDFLSFAYGAAPILNVALGYQWEIKENLLLMAGLRTDFNSFTNANLDELSTYPTLKTTNYNIYHATGGIQFQFKQHLLVAGTQLSFGYKDNLTQIANFSEYTPDQEPMSLPLFGVNENNMETYYFSISLFLGATFNFEKKEKTPTD